MRKSKLIFIAVGVLFLIAAFLAFGTHETTGGYEKSAVLSDNLAEEMETPQEGQKLVYTGYMTIKTNNIKKSSEEISEKMKSAGAVFEYVSKSDGYKNMTIRIPRENFMKFTESLSEMNVVSSEINVEDKTKTYTDNKKRIDILETEYKELKVLMGKAKNVDEILAIRDRMVDVNAELETLKGSNETIDYDSDMARLELTLEDSGSPVSFGSRIKEALSDSIYTLEEFFLFVVSIWWVIAVICLAGFLVVRRLRQRK